MPRLDHEIIINRPVEEVFDYVADGRNEPRYNPHMPRVEQTTAGPIGRGTRFCGESRLLGRPLEMATEITAYERPRRLTTVARTTLGLRTPRPVLDAQGTTTFDPVPGGTRVHWTLEVAPRGLLRPLTPLVTRALGQRLTTAFATVKRLLDAPLPARSVAPSVRRMLQELLRPLRSRGVGAVSRVGLVGTAALTLYVLLLRPRQLRWGATDEEVRRALPGDDVVAHPTFNATRALTIAATPEQIWPWLVQMGFHRAGWYSYDWIDNLGEPSAECLVPDLQHLSRGDLIPMSPDGKIGVWVKDFELHRWLLWWDKAGTTWLWVLDPVDAAHTRLLSRVRMRYQWTSPVILFQLLFDVGDIVMMRCCLRGIKRRAERHAGRSAATAPPLHGGAAGSPSTAGVR